MLQLYIASAIIYILSAILIICGIWMAIRYKKEAFRVLWSLLMILSGFVMLTEATLAVQDVAGFVNPTTIPFSVRILLEWHAISLLVAMLCVIGLRSKLTRFQLIYFPTMLLICVVTAICYHLFIGTYTPLHSWQDIIANISREDVMMKVVLFTISLINPTYLLYYPFYSKIKAKDVKLTGWFKFYIFFVHAQPLFFILYVLGFPIAGICLSVGHLTFVVCFSYAIAKNRNPMVVKLKSFSKEDEILAASLDKVNEAMRINKYYLDKSLNIEILQDKTGIAIDEIIKNYTSKGYTSFMEFVNSYRYDYFNSLQKQYPGIPHQILVSDSGFPSQASFDSYVQSISEKPVQVNRGILSTVNAFFL